MLKLNTCISIRHLIFYLGLLLALPSPTIAPPPPNVQDIIDRMNARLREEGGVGNFDYVTDMNGSACIVFSEYSSPGWAIDGVLDSLGAVKGYGTGGIDPFKFYTHEEWTRTPEYHYSMGVRNMKDIWKDRSVKHLGLGIVGETVTKLGPTVFKDMYEYEMRSAWWREQIYQTIPMLIRTLKNKQVLVLCFAGVMLFLGLPLLIWNGSKAFFNWIFVSRPQIIGPEDTDIYKGFLSRLSHRSKKLPKVIVNESLAARIKQVVSDNKKITKHNKRAWRRAGILRPTKGRKPYAHILAYGDAGVGKTLFAKKLALKSGMHYIYCTMADFAQCNEEDGLRNFKEVLNYANAHWPVVLIIDEFDILFSSSDLKMKKMRVLLQKFFSNATHTGVQLFCITNYPDRVPSPILSRLGEKIHFDRPSLSTLRKLFAHHLGNSLRNKKQVESLAMRISEECLKGIVGRDVQYIASRLAMRDERSPQALDQLIEQVKQEKKMLKNFRMDDEKAE